MEKSIDVLLHNGVDMKAIALVDHLTESELIEKIRHEKDASVRDRYRAILWIHQGESRGEIAKRLGIVCNTLCRWVKGYNSVGESGLHRQPGQGRKRTLTPERVENIKNWVNSEEGVWTLKRMMLKLEEMEGITVTQQAIWYRLHESRWSWKTGRPTNPEGDKDAQEAFQKRGLIEAVEHGSGVIFADSMRYGLISNPWRNWGPVGERVAIPKQMEFDWGYLWTEIDVLSGDVNVWFLPEMNGETLSRIVAKIPEKWGNNVALVWDNAGAHKSAAKRLPDGVSVIPLPAYSPELNPVERFFQELRRRIANKIFGSLEELEDALSEALEEYFQDKEAVRKLCSYPWIVEQMQGTG
jgi:transposase